MPRAKKAPQTKIQVACLSVSTWKGTIACGQHYYGRMDGSLTKPDKNGSGGKVYYARDVEYTLTASQAKRLNKDEAYLDRGLCTNYMKGDTSSRFYDEEHLHAAAIEHAKALGYDALILGDPGTCQPQKLLFGPECEKLNALYDAFEDNGGWDRDEEKAETLNKEWQAIAYPLGLIDVIGAPQFNRKR